MRAIAAAFLLTTLAGQTEAFHFQTTVRPQLMLSKSAPSALRTVSTSSSLPPGQLSLLRCPRHAQLALLEEAQASQPLEKAGIWAAWFAYLALVLFSEGSIAPGASALHTEPETISEAISLSLNFWFVLPTIAPQVAPVLSPSLEAVFNVIVSWSALFFGFAVDESEYEFGPVGMLPFLVGGLFLTNVFYLPMLAMRAPRDPTAEAPPLTSIQAVGESRAFAMVLGLLPLLALCWFEFGRADLAGTFVERMQELVQLVQTDRLAFSFISDAIVFGIFQGALVPSDAARRGASDASWRPVILAARLIPYYGLVLWFLTRPALPANTE